MPAQDNLATAIQGELTIDVEHTTGDDVSVACNMILLAAFDASYKQVYGFDGMIVAIEAEAVVPDGGVDRRKLRTSTASYVVYWRCRYCRKDPSGKNAYLTDFRADQEVVMLAIIQESTCEAFQSATAVTIGNVETYAAGAALKIAE
ncbi:hypothetical protein MHU86_10494 [Fragilaria crotonensis]|nr:hypothetical protein MHU86_10494 [Fragilaria crotonensis]